MASRSIWRFSTATARTKLHCKNALAKEMDAPFGCYEFDSDGRPHWRNHLFADYVQRNQMSWPTLSSGALDQRDQTFREMEGLFPQIGPLRELRYSLSKLRLNALSVGTDGRNRVLLSPYGSKTGRNQPSNARYIFGPAKWLRFLITPPPGRVSIHRDYRQQEHRSRRFNPVMLHCWRRAGAVTFYLGIAKQLGLAPPHATAKTHEALRAMFKTVVLGIVYGLGARTLRRTLVFSCLRPGKFWHDCALNFMCLRSMYRMYSTAPASC